MECKAFLTRKVIIDTQYAVDVVLFSAAQWLYWRVTSYRPAELIESAACIVSGTNRATVEYWRYFILSFVRAAEVSLSGNMELESCR